MNGVELDLLRRAAGNGDGLHFHLSREEWDDLLMFARKQAVLGVTFDAMDSLPDDERPPLAVYSQWALATEKIEHCNAESRKNAVSLYGWFSRNGRRSCILKGLGAARYYPVPSHRQPGDIDIWVEASREDTLDLLAEHDVKVGMVVYHHCEASFFRKTDVEVHFTPSWMNGYFANRRLQRFFSECSEAQFSNVPDGMEFAVPTNEFAAIYGMIHIFRHVFHEGIGLRQIMDEYFVLRSLTDDQIRRVSAEVRRFVPEPFIGSVMYVCEKVFGMDTRYRLCRPSRRKGEKLLDSILSGGNFGTHDKSHLVVSSDNLVQRATKRILRSSRFFLSYPREFLTAPFFKMWQYFWRRSRGYL